MVSLVLFFDSVGLSSGFNAPLNISHRNLYVNQTIKLSFLLKYTIDVLKVLRTSGDQFSSHQMHTFFR